MRIILPWPPTVNTYTACVRNRKILSKKGRQYKKDCAGIIYEAHGKLEAISGDVAVFIFLTPPDNRKRDIDNYIKAVLDALTEAGAWEDDSQIKQLNVSMFPKCGKGSVSVSIEGKGITG